MAKSGVPRYTSLSDNKGILNNPTESTPQISFIENPVITKMCELIIRNWMTFIRYTSADCYFEIKLCASIRLFDVKA